MLGTASAAHRNDASIPIVYDEKDLERGNEGEASGDKQRRKKQRKSGNGGSQENPVIM